MIATFNTQTATGWTGVAVFPLRTSVGGTVQTLTVSGAMAVAGGLLRQPTRGAAGALPSSGALTRAPVHPVGGTLGATSVLRRVPGVIRTGLVPGAGTLISVRQVVRTLTGTSPLAGTLQRRPVTPLTGLVGSTGTVRAQLTRGWTGTLVSAGGLGITPQLRSAGTLGFAGTLEAIRSQLLTVTGALSMTGILRWHLTRTLTGVLMHAGALITTPIIRSFAGVMAFVGGFVPGVTLPVAGTLASEGAVAMSQAQAVLMTGTVPSTGALLHQPTLELPGSLGLDSLLMLEPDIALQGSLGSEGGLALGTDQQLTGTLGLDGTLELAGDTVVDATGSLPLAGTASLARTLSVSGQLSAFSTRVVTVIPSAVKAGVLALAGAFTLRLTRQVEGQGVVPLTGAVQRGITQAISGLVTPVGTAYQQASIWLASGVNLAGDVSFVGVEVLALSGVIAPSGLLAAPVLERLVVGVLGPAGALLLFPAILVFHGTIRMVHALLRFAGLTAPKLTGHATPTDPALGDHATLDDSELR